MSVQNRKDAAIERAALDAPYVFLKILEFMASILCLFLDASMLLHERVYPSNGLLFHLTFCPSIRELCRFAHWPVADCLKHVNYSDRP